MLPRQLEASGQRQVASVAFEHHGSHTVPFGCVWKWGIPQMAIEMNVHGEIDFLMHVFFPSIFKVLLPFSLGLSIRHAVKL